jgi:hypothetical protein
MHAEDHRAAYKTEVLLVVDTLMKMPLNVNG